MQDKKQQLEPDMEQVIGSKLGNKYKVICCHLVYLTLYAEYIMWNARLVELQAGTQIGRRNIYNLRYADYTTLMAESEEEIKNLLMRVKEESERADFEY